jgi:AraC-like DNA-binding protein
MSRRAPNSLEEWLRVARLSRYRASVVARALRISERQLERITHKVFGRGPQAWLSEQRLLASANMLKERRSVKFVALELGFKQVSHFSRVFKLRHGISPREFLERSDREALLTQLETGTDAGIRTGSHS